MLTIAFQLVTFNSFAQYSKLLDFEGATVGRYPYGDLISDGTFLYGMTVEGGTNNLGTIFKIMPDGTGYSRLLDFAGATNGRFPRGSLISDGTFLYGMTSGGGTNGQGTIFKIMPNGTGYAKLLDFTRANGSSPGGSLISDGTFLYGMTEFGGTMTEDDRGTIFKIMPDGTGFAMLWNFPEAANGRSPRGSLISDGTFLYGMTRGGGTNNLGTIFKIMPDGTGYAKLLDFAGVANGSTPYGSLISDGTFLYGMTVGGGTNGLGTIFKIMPDGTGYAMLLDFAGAANGRFPNGSLISDGTFLYGMTGYYDINDKGTIFKIMPDGTGYTKLLDFTGATNGSGPYGSLISVGTFLYGMTSWGGTNDMGTIFKIMPDGTGYAKLLDFAGTADGDSPFGSLISDGTFLYGMTSGGGTNGLGTLFKIKPDGTGYARLLDFAGAANGSSPGGSLISDGTFLYGMTVDGGTNDLGTIFKIMPDGTGYAKLLDFDGANGSSPQGSLISVGTFLYGMTSYGGTNDQGTIFKIMPDGTGYAKLLDFAGAANGRGPRGALISVGTFLYGMTTYGGTNDQGTIFKIMPDGTGYAMLLDFAGANGIYPYGSLISDGTFLYGMTAGGGTNGMGTIFKIMPDGTGYAMLLDFAGANGSGPQGDLISDGTFLYGRTTGGGTNDLGTIFKIMPDGTGYAKLLDFAGAANGSYPLGSLISDGTFLYGMTYGGGTNNMGTVFKYLLAPAVPTITNFSPASGPIGTTVTITGTNFSSTPASNIVFFGATQATVANASSTSLDVIVPTGATYKPISILVGGLTAYSASPFVVTFSGGGIIDACSFAAKVDFNTGLNPLGIAVSDFDGDGKPDVAITNRTSQTLAVYRNISTAGSIGTSSLAGPVNFPTQADPFSAMVGDMDGDGKPDLIVPNAISSTVSVFRNTSSSGTISFATRVDFAAGNNPLRSAIRDLDGDGKPELAVCNRFSNSISVYKNISIPGAFTSTSFAAPVNFITGSEPYSVAVADLDGDGKPEMVAVNNLSNSVSVYKNTSTTGIIDASSFAPKVDFITGNRPNGIAIGDLDGDSKVDIVVTNNFAGSTISILQNISSGSITAGSFAAKVDFTSGSDPFEAMIGDLDGDGKPDLAVTNGASNTVSIFKNTSSVGSISSGSFANKVDFVTGTAPYGFQIGDLDGDGRPEVLAGNHNSNTLSILRNTVSSLVPNISNFTPTSGLIGATVTITGSNFSTTPSENIVMFNGVTATITASTATTLTATVPIGATTGPIDITIGCNAITSTTNFTVIICPAAPSPIPNQGCQNTAVTLGALGGVNGQYRWYSVATGGTAIAGEVNSSYTTPSISATTTYFVSINNGTCESSRTTVTATINSLPATPTAIGASSCGPASPVTLIASGGTNGQYRWYTSSTGGTAIAGETNSSYTTPSISATTTYFVSINNGTCESSRTTVTATINSLPTAPTVTGASSCGPASPVTLIATGGTNGQYRWYTTATGGVAITGEVNSSYTTPSISATTTY